MNWEQSRALTPLKRDFLERFFARNQRFFLTGGSALGIFYLDHRLSYDLDFFTTEAGPIQWHLLENQVLAIVEEMQAKSRAITAAPEFHRFEITRGSERELLDFVLERVPQVDPQKAQVGVIRVDTIREIAVNKLCTLLSRCELKDVIDLYFLQQRGFDLVALIPLAQQKEGGLDPAMISYLLADLKVERIPEYVLEPLTPRQLVEFIRALQQTMAALAFPKS
jgi:hypothetical protein